MTTIIAISGYPGSGKSTLRELLSQRLRCDFLDYDQYQQITERPITEIAEWHNGSQNFDEFLIPELGQHLEALKRGEDVKEFDSNRVISAGEYLLFETPLGREHQASGSLIDTLIWLDLPLDTALARNILKFLHIFKESKNEEQLENINWLTEYLDNYMVYVRGMLLTQQQKVGQSADIVLDASKPIDAVLDEALQSLGIGRVS